MRLSLSTSLMTESHNIQEDISGESSYHVWYVLFGWHNAEKIANRVRPVLVNTSATLSETLELRQLVTTVFCEKLWPLLCIPECEGVRSLTLLARMGLEDFRKSYVGYIGRDGPWEISLSTLCNTASRHSSHSTLLLNRSRAVCITSSDCHFAGSRPKSETRSKHEPWILLSLRRAVLESATSTQVSRRFTSHIRNQSWWIRTWRVRYVDHIVEHGFRVVCGTLGACENRSKTNRRNVGSIPIPESVTDNCRWWSRKVTVTSIFHH